MSTKTKIEKDTTNLLATIGMLVMSFASIAGFSDQKNITQTRSTVVPTQSVLVAAPAFEEDSNQIVKEKEEVAPDYVSYSEVQRTAPRASKY